MTTRGRLKVGSSRYEVVFRDGPGVEPGPDADERAYEAWALSHDATIMHRNVDDELPLNVYAYQEDGLIHIVQGADTVVVPLDQFGSFVDGLEALYAT